MNPFGHSTLLIGEDSAELARMAASVVIASIREGLATSDHYDWVLSGGNTPKLLFDEIVRSHGKDPNWSQVNFFWGDERNVPPDHSESNFKMAKEHLLIPLGIKQDRIFRIRPELGTAAKAAEDYEQRLRQIMKDKPCFGLVMLGLGDDGHTASLFPDAWSEWAEDERRGRWVSAPWVPHLRAHRITLLPRLLNLSSKAVFLVSGEGKANILREVLSFDPARDKPRYPSQLIRPVPDQFGHARKPLWLVDRAAATAVTHAA